MRLEQFGNKMCGALKEVLGEGYEIAFRDVAKNNGVRLHGIVITGKDSNVSPAIYIDELYEEHEAGRAFGDIVYDILRVYKKNAREVNMDMEFFTQFSRAKSRILYKLIHRESNRELLAEIPYVDWQDLAVVFYYAFEDAHIGKATILIRNSHLAMWGIDVPALYETAQTNMLRLRPEEMLPIGQLIQEFMGHKLCHNRREMTAEMPKGIGKAAERSSRMYVLSNCDRVFGASALLYSRSMRLLAGELNKNLVILPSSVHEVILVPDDGITEKSFYREMVKEVNDTQVDPEERLSYNVYYYDRVLEKVTILD
ncbi:MAG: DUF5688 family protein [Blautia sp.]|nr:DUF5688 family protein [Blautia sp.]MCM1202473.1 DUF5688 family protein [Bacteroides fragilis]